MNSSIRRLLFWTPRILGIVFAGLISLFALDVFTEGYGLGRALLALLMHLIPTGVIVTTLVLAWRWSWIGAVVFTAIAGFYAVWASDHPLWILTISGPLLLIGALFFLNWRLKGISDREEVNSPRGRENDEG